MVRTSGERRLSNFMLLECAYAELVFLDDLWPDVGPDALACAVREYAGRDRRFGGRGARAGVDGGAGEGGWGRSGV